MGYTVWLWKRYYLTKFQRPLRTCIQMKYNLVFVDKYLFSFIFLIESLKMMNTKAVTSGLQYSVNMQVSYRQVTSNSRDGVSLRLWYIFKTVNHLLKKAPQSGVQVKCHHSWSTKQKPNSSRTR